MKTLDNCNFRELDQDEIQEVEGGFIKVILVTAGIVFLAGAVTGCSNAVANHGR